MKKIIISLIMVTFVLLFNGKVYADVYIVSEPEGATTYYVLSPNGTQILAKMFPNDMSDDERSLALSETINSGYNYELIGDPTFYYNCHSYAWHFHGKNLPSNSSQSCWIGDPILYITDNSYRLVNYNEVSAGDIITYWNNDKITHSGIVALYNGTVNVSSLETIYVNSKLGYKSLVGHFATDVEYYNEETTIRFYTDYHSVASFTSISAFNHSGVCTICGRTITESHSMYLAGAFYRCHSCNYKETYIPIIKNGITYYLFALDETQTLMTELELKTYLLKNKPEYFYSFNQFVGKEYPEVM